MIGFRLPENEQPDHVWDDSDQATSAQQDTESIERESAPRHFKPEDTNDD